MPIASNPDRLKAYRLRDVIARGRRELSRDDRAWLLEYDKAHPPRGKHKRPAEPKGAPLPSRAPEATPANDNAPARLTVETIPASAPTAAPGAPPAIEGAPGAAANDNAPTGPAAANDNAPPLAMPHDPLAPAVASSNAVFTALLAGMVRSEVVAWADRMGHEIGKAELGKGIEWVNGCMTRSFDRWFPSGPPSQSTDDVVTVGSIAAIMGGPPTRKWLDDKDKKATAKLVSIPSSPAVEPSRPSLDAEVPPLDKDPGAHTSGY